MCHSTGDVYLPPSYFFVEGPFFLECDVGLHLWWKLCPSCVTNDGIHGCTCFRKTSKDSVFEGLRFDYSIKD